MERLSPASHKSHGGLFLCLKADTITGMEIPEEAKKLFEKNEIYLGTTDGMWPNVTVTQSGVISSDDEVLICDCAMTQAKENILKNPNCCIEVYDKESEVGYKSFGKATYRTDKAMMEIANKKLEGEPFKPKGVVVIKIEKIFKIE